MGGDRGGVVGQGRRAGPMSQQVRIGQAAEGDVGQGVADLGGEGGQVGAMAVNSGLWDRAAVRVGRRLRVEIQEDRASTRRLRTGAQAERVLYQLGGVAKDSRPARWRWRRPSAPSAEP